MRIVVGGLHCTYPYQSPPLSCSQYLSHMHITSVIPFESAKTISSPATDRSPSFAKQNLTSSTVQPFSTGPCQFDPSSFRHSLVRAGQ